MNGNIYDIIESYLIYKNKCLKNYLTECESKFNDYKDEDVEEKEKIVNKKLSELPIQQLINPIELNELLWDFDAVSLYPSAKWGGKKITLESK